MGYEDRVPEKIRSMGQRADASLALWQAIAVSFEAEGAQRVDDELKGRMAVIRDRFDTVLAKLEDML